VLEGGQGAGTVATWKLQATKSRVRDVEANVEVAGHTVIEKDANSTMVTNCTRRARRARLVGHGHVASVLKIISGRIPLVGNIFPIGRPRSRRRAELRAQQRFARAGLDERRHSLRSDVDRIGEHHARPANSAGLRCLRRDTPELATHRRLIPVGGSPMI
jgi:hypothetical protein